MGGHWNAVTRTSTKCNVCTSAYREEIEDRLNKGASLKAITAWAAKQKPPEEISRHSLKRHKLKHGFKLRIVGQGVDGKKEVVDEIHLASLNDFLDLVIEKVQKAVKAGTLKPTVMEGVKAAEIKGKIKEGSKWEKELLAFFLGVTDRYGNSD